MRLIDGDELLEHVWRDRLDTRERIANLVKFMPTIEPQRIKGKWLKKESVGRWDDILWECSECGCLHSDNVFCISGNFNFCPNCGAWMLGEPYKGNKMIKKVIELIRRNQCVECKLYVKENETCQSKKCASNDPYVTKMDRMFCEPYKEE